MESDASGYLWGVRGYSSSVIKKHKKRYKKKLEKFASYTQLIINMFLTKYNHNRLHHLASLSDFLSLLVLSQKLSAKVIEVMETKFKLQTQAAHDLRELLYYKTQ